MRRGEGRGEEGKGLERRQKSLALFCVRLFSPPKITKLISWYTQSIHRVAVGAPLIY